MEPLIEYTIPFQGLRDGLHQFEFLVEGSFFRLFESSLVKECSLVVNVEMDKRPDMLIFYFNVSGSIESNCDRCLQKINLPVTGRHRLLVKPGEGESEDPEIILIDPGAHNLNIAPYVYEFICLSIPMTSVYDCENDEEVKCNEEMLSYLEAKGQQEKPGNPIWDELKNFKNI